MTIESRTDARGRQHYRARVNVKDPDTGKWFTVPGDWTRSEKVAERNERALLTRRDRGTLAPARGATLARYLAFEHLPAVRRVSRRGRPLAPTTDAKYRHHVALIAGVIGDIRMSELRTRHVERLRDELLRQGLAPQTVADVLRFLAQALRRAVAKGNHRPELGGSVGREPAGWAGPRLPDHYARAWPRDPCRGPRC